MDNRMKSFKQFISEDKDFVVKNRELIPEDKERFAKLVNEKCKPFLKECGELTMQHLLYRGIEIPDFKFIKTVRTDRQPKDTNKILHVWLDNWFNENFGVRYRTNAMFCTGDIKQTKEYGEPCVVFPIGDFKFVWSPHVEDLYERIGIYGNAIQRYKRQDDPKGLEETHQKIIKRLEDAHYTDNFLREAIDSDCEIMMSCKEYLYVPEWLFTGDLLKMIKGD